ncbi:MAG: radical SAM protein, partial [Clostridia bacterium]|nr:radical SAM protein [Clostridia bacterium]
MSGIYVHIPFCKQKCRYCDFTSFPDKINLAESYMTCLYHEMAMRGEELKDYTFDTLYIGGGTPSVVDESYIAMLVAAAKKYFKLAQNAEITIEMNPGTVSASKIALYKKCGINRFSVGLQTAVDSQLEDLGRCHNLNEFLSCAKLLKGENFSVDIMIGLKGQTLADIEKSIEVAANSGASHISMYALTPEDGTPIYTDYLNGEL